MRIALAFSLLCLLLFVGSALADEIDCGSVGPTRSVASGTYGPMFGYSPEEACTKVIAGGMLTDTCKECPEEQEGCYWSENWEGGDPYCDARVVPGTNPPIYIANITLTTSKRGWVSCSRCDIDPGGH